MTKRAPGALNYIDPTWDNASPDGRLYPFYFKYFAGFVPDYDFTNDEDGDDSGEDGDVSHED